MLDQVQTLLWLRYTILRHTLGRGKTASRAVLALLGTLAFAASAAAGIGLYYVGTAIPQSKAWLVLVIGDAVLFVLLLVWASILLMELQRSELINVRKMLHLPVPVRMVFLLNFALSLLSPTLFLLTIPFVGLCAGLAAPFGWGVLAGGFVLTAVFYVMLSAWAYYLLGLLAIVMENKRRRRLLLTLIPLFFVILGQLPNLIQMAFSPQQGQGTTNGPRAESAQPQGSRDGRIEAAWAGAAEVANACIPLGWLPYGLYALAAGWPGPALACMAGLALAAGLGLAVGYRSTWRYYMGATGPPGKAAERPAAGHAAGAPSSLMERPLPLLSDDTAAMTLASFLNWIRVPNTYAMVFMPVFIGMVLLAMAHTGRLRLAVLHGDLAPLAVTVWPFLGFGPFMFNLFGPEREGFRTLILLPTDRKKYLLAKNLALFPFTVGTGLVFVGVSAVFIRPPAAILATCAVQVLQLFVLFAIVGNFLSVYFPYRLAWEGLRGTNTRSARLLSGLGSLGVSLLVMAPTALFLLIDPALDRLWGPHGAPVGLLCSVLFLALTAEAYRRSLSCAGRLLQKREPDILDRLVRDRE